MKLKIIKKAETPHIKSLTISFIVHNEQKLYTQDKIVSTVNRLFLSLFSSLRLLTKIFHPKIFHILTFSLQKNFKTKY